MTEEAEPKDPAAVFLASLIAQRFYELSRERAKRVGRVSDFLPFLPWRDAAEETRDGLTELFGQLMKEAAEQREEWTRAFIEAEIVRLRESIELRDPEALRRIGARPPDGYAVNLHPFEPPTDTLRDCTGEPVGFRERVSPDFISGADFVRLRNLDAQVLKAGRRLLQLRDSLQTAAAAERAQVAADAPISSAVRQAAAERLNLFAVELESIVYEAGLAERPKDEGSAEG